MSPDNFLKPSLIFLYTLQILLYLEKVFQFCSEFSGSLISPILFNCLECILEEE